MIAVDRDYYAYLDEMKLITILLPHSYHDGVSSTFTFIYGNERTLLKIISQIYLADSVKYICRIDKDITMGDNYWIEDEHGGKTDLQMGAVIRTEEFDQKYYYDGPLGVLFNRHETTFKLWAPTASQVKLKLESPDHSVTETIEMVREDKGVWTVTVFENLDSYRYSYLVCVNLEWKEAVDPYAVSVTANGLCGVVIDLEKTKQRKPELPPFNNAVDAIIYETNIRDFTIYPYSGVFHKGSYLGAAELHTLGKNGKPTALSYVKELGITHIEFLPLHDFEGVDEFDKTLYYNWGYNPIHFNSPEGSYATDPTDPYVRINELKTLITTIHSIGIRVILDVVYNHVYVRETSSFEKIVPGYFFRHDHHGIPSNGTGVGNDFASERLMARKFIVDSVKFWLQEYQVDGFRFDLMGILDVDTMNSVRKMIDTIDPSVLVIGEGWDLPTPIPYHKKAIIANQNKLPNISHFNDQFRDSIKGSTFQIGAKGYALGNTFYYDAAKDLLSGSIGLARGGSGIFIEPNQTVNYVECHDNHTLWDKLSISSPNDSEEKREKQHRLATVMVLLSQGIPFLHSGQEFFRTKEGVGNSYSSPDWINQLDWDRKDHYIENVEYIKGCIAIRQSSQAFRLATADLIREHFQFLEVDRPIIGYQLKEVKQFGKWKNILVYFNPIEQECTIKLPKGIWMVLANHEKAQITPFAAMKETLTLQPISTNVLVSHSN
ncbi:type I pullulanase [Bacillus sp. 03113]|uniref:type I pullulanase n=1 Tax=Bacillus sp. 03113 TaxID=2578211 RepID=UPI001143D5EE|nr:type I pullulanase [Bacillus sp. 03113]